MNIKSLFLQLFMPNRISKIASTEVVAKFRNQPAFPFLVSFPRTGSHWLRIILEQYTDQPLLVRSFYKHTSANYLLLHTHDMFLKETSQNVIYLYRNPTDVIYSQINYHHQDFMNDAVIINWSTQYAVHLIHWIYKENFSTQKILVKYEALKFTPSQEFKKICAFFDMKFDANKLENILKKITKETVKNQTKHDENVINLNNNYELKRTQFKKEKGQLIKSVFQQVCLQLKVNYDELSEKVFFND